MSDQKKITTYRDYLYNENPDVREAFLAGCHAAIGTVYYRNVPQESLTPDLSDTDIEQLLTENDQRRELQSKLATQTIIACSSYDRSILHALLFDTVTDRNTAKIPLAYCGNTIMQIGFDDQLYISELIKCDISLADDTLLRRYIIATGPRGPLHKYRNAVADGILIYHQYRPEFGGNYFIAALTRAGNFTSTEQLELAQAQIVANATSADQLTRMSVQTIENLHQMVLATQQTVIDEATSRYTDEMLATYRDVNSHPLSGAVFENGKWIQKYHSATHPVTIDEQRAYIAYILFPRIREKLLEALDHDISAEALADMRPDTFLALKDLVEDLVEDLPGTNLGRYIADFKAGIPIDEAE